MNAPPRFLFDECVGKPLMLALEREVGSQFEFVHLCDYFRAGIPDNEWIPQAAGGNWIVVTGDSGKHSGKGKKLPDLCRNHSITHIILGPKLHHQSGMTKRIVIADLWPLIETLPGEPAGSRYRIVLRTVAGVSGYRLVHEVA
ncbi:PIN-like domain-containing protein [Zavarzinella formosa]|uniref:PIN-like domain-containing protein n=1 Tax=Zavarzinella formosa TaxID=360055 RepID=UPI0002E73E91|nr:hypothetical protein [Zavarzinella formosa]